MLGLLRDFGVVGLELTCNDDSLSPSVTAGGGAVEALLFRQAQSFWNLYLPSFLPNISPSAEDISLMEEAKRRKIYRSVQAGEFGSSEMVFQVRTQASTSTVIQLVLQALEKLLADRITFGYRVVDDPALYQDCIRNKIHFAVCPTVSLANR